MNGIRVQFPSLIRICDATMSLCSTADVFTYVPKRRHLTIQHVEKEQVWWKAPAQDKEKELVPKEVGYFG